eukprot:363203-Chlamydomonas_euryale.AAC.16
MADRHAARLVRIIRKVGLRVQVRRAGDDFDRLLVCTDCAVGAHAPEHALLGARRQGVHRGADRQVRVGHVIDDADGELLLGAACRQAKPAAHDQSTRTGAVHLRLGNRRQHILVQRLAVGARLLGTVEHADALGRLWYGREQVLSRPWPEQPHLDHADLLALGVEVVDRLVHDLAAAAHDDDHAVGVRCTIVVEQAVLAPSQRLEVGHGVEHVAARSRVVGVGGLSVLEVHVRALRRAALVRVRGVEAARAVVLDRGTVDRLRHDLLDASLRDEFDLVDLVARAEAVEEVHKRDASAQGREVRDQRHVMRLLHAVRAQHGPARLRHVTMAERGHATHTQMVSDLCNPRQTTGEHSPWPR